MRESILDRFDLRPLIRDHFRSMQLPNASPDWAARSIVVLVPVVVGVLSYLRGWRLTDPSAISGASALIAGIMFGAFTQLAAFRDRIEGRRPFDATTRRHFRETAAHLMAGALASALEAAVLVVASGIRPNPDAKLDRVATCVVLALGSYVLVLFIMAIRRMYSAYLRVFEGGQYLRSDKARARQRREQLQEQAQEQAAIADIDASASNLRPGDL
ncbi:hypothetical protein O7600_17465 [Micromonospora sp. WMMA1998]|uniref:hypothetical protein n=1 Tax=Micromonospora sp. WMMA1998 TaxID=3015167 RepID=UPI00248CBD78|nr:hypothetical protein [Micromonospora sp. WMMA1998]WBC12963.1 hypothetical protein O7600_17465 [Micromonospora sp. WMMA1998]